MKVKQQGKAKNKRYDRDIHRGHVKKAGTIAKIKRQDGAYIDDRPLHPSWEAKRRLKENMTASIVPSQGKKIVF